jgi:hypothetical protein
MAISKSVKLIKNEIYANLAVAVAVAVLIVGGLAYWAHSFIGDMVQRELAAQKVYFPEKGSAAFNASTYPELQKYAGQIVDTPEKAEAYANGFIGRHLQKVANGKVYSEVSAESMKNPTDLKLQQQKQTLFQGETLRGILLTSGYGFGTIGEIAGVTALLMVILAAVFIVLSVLLRIKS